MRKLNGTFGAALIAAALSAGTASAQNLNIDELGAALALPFITGDQGLNKLSNGQGDVVITNQSAVTLITVTNGSAVGQVLKVDLISGDEDSTPGGPDNWRSLSFDCYLTGRETTTFVFVPNITATPVAAPGNGESIVYVECSDPNDPSDTNGDPTAFNTEAQNGIFFAAVASATGEPIPSDLIFGDAVVVDIALGQAYSVEAIPFGAGPGGNNGDKVYGFGVPNGAPPPFAQPHEYLQFPSILASNFIAPRTAPAIVNAELILFTLDGTTQNFPPPRVAFGGFGYNDDEEFFDFQWTFDCFDIVSLTDINPNFLFTPGGPLGLGSISGHFALVPQAVATPNDAHDAAFGNGNNTRRRPFHGWLVQNVQSVLLSGNEPITGTPAVPVAGGYAAWGRPLNQNTTGFVPAPGDQVVFDADPTLP